MDEEAAQDVRVSHRDATLVVDERLTIVAIRGRVANAAGGASLAACFPDAAAELTELCAAARKSDVPVAPRVVDHDGRAVEVEAVAAGVHVALLLTDVAARRRADAREAALAAITGDIAFVLHADGTVAATTQPAVALLGNASLVGRDLAEMVHPDDRTRLLELMAGVASNQTSPLRLAADDGGYRTVEVRASAALDGEIVVSGADATARRGDAALLTAQHAVLEHLAGVDELGRALDSIARFAEEQAAGAQVALYRVAGDELELAASPSLPAAWARAARRIAAPDAELHGAVPVSGIVADLGIEHGLGVGWLMPARPPGGDPVGAVLLLAAGPRRFPTAAERDALDAGAALAALAIGHERNVVAASERERHDELTGLLTRGALHDQLETWARDDLAVVLVHVRGIGVLNERLGYEAGDTVLRAVAAELQAAVRGRDVLARLRGATFAVVSVVRRGTDGSGLAARLAGAVPGRVAASGRRVDIAVAVAHVTATPGEFPLAVLARAEGGLAAARSGPGTRSGTGPTLR
jgi:diguanylate cyclase (GGDEF)-like protein